MAAVTPAAKTGERKLGLKEVLDWMVEDGLLDAASASKALSDIRMKSGPARHPVTGISELRLRSARTPSAPLTAPYITEWLAGRVKMPFYNIDPLKIDMKSVTGVMSADYAAKRSILPVEISGKDLTVAVAEPFMSSWEGELASMLRLNVKRVLSNPVDIERYQGEFFNLARSMKRAESSGVQVSGLSNFEQLVELGKAGRTLDANDHHICLLYTSPSPRDTR